jgi:hypothetical protein
MTQISVWGPLTWYFFHTLAEKIKEESYDKMKHKILEIITAFCNHLPCEDCSMHASNIMRGISINNISTKAELQTVLFNFHNTVSNRVSNTCVDKNILDKYKGGRLPIIITKLYTVFHTRDKKYMMNEFNRKIMLNSKRSVIIEILKHCDH